MFTTAWSVRRTFPARTMDAIEAAIRQSEAGHAGQIRFAVEHSLDLPELLRGLTARERAIDAFSHLRVWDTEHNNGVLIYVQLVSRHIDIVADRGVARKVEQAEWNAVCREMEQAFRRGAFEEGALAAIGRISALLATHYPKEQPHAL
jgi:uncharacterized membrane protein